MADGLIAGAAPRRVCVIGAGLGGLALALRLQAAGIATVLIEARAQPGGFTAAIERGGFRFDGGPAALSDLAALADLDQLLGGALIPALDLQRIAPGWRFNWPDGAVLNWSQDAPSQVQTVARFAPHDTVGYEEFLRHAQGLWQDLHDHGQAAARRALAALARLVPGLLRHYGWRSLHGLIAHCVKHDHLRDALSFPALMQGANPFTAPATLAASHYAARTGLWYPRGGMGQLAAALLAQFEALGGTVRLHDPVLHVATLGNRVSEVETASGWRERFDAVASNADALHTWRDLLSETERGRDRARKLARQRYAPSMFVVHFGVEGSWPGIAHNTVLFGPRFKGLIDDIFNHGVLPQDQLIILTHPSVTDPSVAPPGKSTFTAMIPVANQGKLPIDWDALGPLIERRVLAEVGRRLIPDLEDRIVVKFHRSPRDHALDFNAAFGSTFALEPGFAQSGFLRQPARDAALTNLYFVGAATPQGAGTGGVLASARATAQLMIEDLR